MICRSVFPAYEWRASVDALPYTRSIDARIASPATPPL